MQQAFLAINVVLRLSRKSVTSEGVLFTVTGWWIVYAFCYKIIPLGAKSPQ